jgi:hypothetical protein
VAKRPPAQARWAALVLQHLPHDRWISGVELQQLTTLKYQQVIDGVAHLRDEHPDFPLISKPFKGYRFSVDPRDVREFQQWRVSTSFTIMRRAYWGAIAPYLESLPASHERTVVRRNFERALEDLGDLITLSA